MAKVLIKPVENRCSEGVWYSEVWNYPDRKELIIQNGEFVLATVSCDFVGDNPYTIPEAEAIVNAKLMAASKRLYIAAKKVKDTIPPSKLKGTISDNFSEQIALNELNKIICELE